LLCVLCYLLNIYRHIYGWHHPICSNLSTPRARCERTPQIYCFVLSLAFFCSLSSFCSFLRGNYFLIVLTLYLSTPRNCFSILLCLSLEILQLLSIFPIFSPTGAPRYCCVLSVFTLFPIFYFPCNLSYILSIHYLFQA
jgi:hypothetical protein